MAIPITKSEFTLCWSLHMHVYMYMQKHTLWGGEGGEKRNLMHLQNYPNSHKWRMVKMTPENKCATKYFKKLNLLPFYKNPKNKERFYFIFSIQRKVSFWAAQLPQKIPHTVAITNYRHHYGIFSSECLYICQHVPNLFYPGRVYGNERTNEYVLSQ